MSEQKTEVRLVRVSYVCDECKNGTMVPTGMCLSSCPPQYPHKCTNCDATINFVNKRYPMLVYEDIKNDC